MLDTGSTGQKVGAGGTASEYEESPTLPPLPPLREELTLFPGPRNADGTPTWSLQDPVRNLFFRIDWPSFEILARWHLGDAMAIVAAIEADTTLSPDESDVAAMLRFLGDNELLRVADASGSKRYAAIATQRKAGWARWLLHHYLFFRVPLLRPDRLLEQLLPLVAPLFTTGFARLSLLALAVGLIEVVRQWEHFTATLIDTFSMQGMAGYGMALVVVKMLHEFGHALTAKRAGCRVPVMGVAFLVMWPMAYTDVNEAWKLPDRRRRLMVSGAGIVTELALAAWATLAWALLPDGSLRNVMFLLCTTTWVSTLAINASPFMRFDGYFLLCDWLDMPNLHQRAFALARWSMRELLFGLGDPVPEPLSPQRRRGLIAFAYATWLYRLIVFLGIAALVYGFFIKLLGLFLFAVEIAWFILLPAWSELKVWRQRRADILASPRARRTGILAGVLLILTVIPWQMTVVSQGILRPAQSFTVVTPASSRVVSLPVGHGSHVEQGRVLMQFEAPELASREQSLAQRLESLRFQLAGATLDPELRSRRLVLEEELTGVQAQLEGVRLEIARLKPTAPFSGILLDLPPDMAPGQWLARNTKVATLVNPASWRVETYLPETEVARIQSGDWGRFISETPGGPGFSLTVDRVDTDASRLLPEPMLAATSGGEILTRERNRTQIPDQAMYRVSLRVIGDHPQQQVLRGKVVILGEPKTLAGGFLVSFAGLVLREAGF